jgi:hypothetical protein
MLKNTRMENVLFWTHNYYSNAVTTINPYRNQTIYQICKKHKRRGGKGPETWALSVDPQQYRP